MPRSVWKGPFCDPRLLLKAVRVRKDPQLAKKAIRTWSRGSTILPAFVGLRFEIHMGNGFKRLRIKESMIGHKLGEFARTRKYPIHPTKSIKQGAKVSSKGH